MKEIINYNKALQDIYNYFGFVEDWTIYPIDDRLQYFWEITGKEKEVMFYDSYEAYEKQDDSHTYSNEILHHRFYPKAIYKGNDYTMIMVDTHTDGNKFLAIFDNSKHVINYLSEQRKKKLNRILDTKTKSSNC